MDDLNRILSKRELLMITNGYLNNIRGMLRCDGINLDISDYKILKEQMASMWDRVELIIEDLNSLQHIASALYSEEFGFLLKEDEEENSSENDAN